LARGGSIIQKLLRLAGPESIDVHVIARQLVGDDRAAADED
jgi:hypothetical protein